MRTEGQREGAAWVQCGNDSEAKLKSLQFN